MSFDMRNQGVVVVTVLASFCGVAHATIQHNGPQIHGVPDGKVMNGKVMNGTALNGIQLNGVQLNGKVMNGATLTGLRLAGTLLTGSYIDAPLCSHSEQSTGAALPATCNACANTVCASDAHCCSTSWDGACIKEALSMCNLDAHTLVGNGTLSANMLASDGTTVPVTLQIKAMRKPAYWVQTQTCKTVNPKCTRAQALQDACPDPVTVCTSQSTNQPAQGPNYDLDIYEITYTDSSGTANPLCSNTDIDGFTNSAIPVPGAWESRLGRNFIAPNGTTYRGGGVIPGTDGAGPNAAFTFGCRNVGAIAKCVEFGYKPQSYGMAKDTSGNAVSASLSELHQACVRMVRADYCGDGQAHTVTGTAIDVADLMSIEMPDPTDTSTGLDYGPEAEWRSFGAACVNQYRFNSTDPTSTTGGTVQSYVQNYCPEVGMQFPTTSSACNYSWNTVMHGGMLSEPSFLVDPITHVAPASLLDYSSTIFMNLQ